MPKEISDKLTYDDLKLGEKAVDMYEAGATPEEIARSSPVYLNTSPVFNNLNVTDLAIAGVLGGLNQIYVGDSGTGKSQLAQDFYDHYFGGNKKDGGEAVKIRGYKLTERTLDELVFEEINLEKGRWDLTNNIDATLFLVDEINRAPTIRQNDCFELGDGRLNRNGRDLVAGREGYNLLIATANLGNGDYQGTFEIDKAMYNRLGIAIDFDYKKFAPSFDNKEFLKILREADSGIKFSPKRNIVNKIIGANKEISRNSTDLGPEASAVLGFLEHGLNNCSKYDTTKNEKWYIQNQTCQVCPLNKKSPKEPALCSTIKSPVRRTIEATRQYAAALDYLIRLKDPSFEVSGRDLMFKAFELTGAYQNLLNPSLLQQKYLKENPEMMKYVIDELKKDYIKNEDRILTTLNSATKGIPPNSLFYYRKDEKSDSVISSGYEKLNSELIQKVKAKGGDVDRNPFEFDDKGALGYSWVPRSAEFNLKRRAKLNRETKQN